MESYVDEILGPKPKEDGHDGPSEMEAISQELIEAVHARNVKDTEAALRAAFACMESEPHDEGPHE